MPVLVEAVKNDSFLGPMTAGSGNPYFLSQPHPKVSPVLLAPRSCLKVQWLGHNRCPISWCVLNFMSFYSTRLKAVQTIKRSINISSKIRSRSPLKCDLRSDQIKANKM